MKKAGYGMILLGLAAISGLNCIAQVNTKSANRQVMLESQQAVDAIAMYPRETRKVIFEASEYPEIITKLDEMQKKSQGTFAALISTFSKEEQEKIWNLTRYDFLISDLAANPKKTKEEINTLLLNYPQEIHKTAIEEQKKNYKLLGQIDKMNKTYESDFELLLNSYPPSAINAFQKLIKMPEVLGILNDNMKYTVIVGNYYKKNPERILHKTDSLNLVLTQKNTQEAYDWKQSMNEDPQAKKEYVQAAQEYAQENGYQADVYNTPMTEFDTNYNSNPYNCWFGYPTWYPDNSWNPNPYWYDWGFYLGSDRQPVFIGLPSSYFMDWYFYSPEHISKFAELSNHYYNYYDQHSESMNYNSVSLSVNNWRNNNRDVVTNDWDFDKTNRVERFRQYGNMEASRRKYNLSNPKQPIGRSEFINKTPNRYYFLNDDVSKAAINQRNSGTTARGIIAEPAKRPTVIIPERNGRTVQQNQVVNQQPVNIGTRQKPATINQPSRSSSSDQMRNAVQYNQNTWRQPQQPQQPQRSQPQPQINRNPTPTRQPEIRQAEQQPTRQPEIHQAEQQPTRQPEIRQAEQPARQNNPSPSNNRR